MLEQNKKLFVLLYFYTQNCSGCQTMDSVLEKIKFIFGNSVHIIPINAEENPSLLKIYTINIVPTFLLLKESTLIWKHTGLLSTQDFERAIRKFL